MKALIEYVAKSLVERPAEVEVTEETVADGSILIKLAAAPQDMGRIIGKQ
ncbi:MAG: KH domain-containing protein, partial [Desulfuromonadales bacterium]|nr:KH domain-containing protein [Desulfuromonadales bacterium]